MSVATELVAQIEAMYGVDSDAANAVRVALTLSRRRKRASQPVETLPYIGLVNRLIRRAGERVADSDEPELAALLALQTTLDNAVQIAVDGQRSIGRSWAHVARASGTTRQSAFERWGGKE